MNILLSYCFMNATNGKYIPLNQRLFSIHVMNSLKKTTVLYVYLSRSVNTSCVYFVHSSIMVRLGIPYNSITLVL